MVDLTGLAALSGSAVQGYNKAEDARIAQARQRTAMQQEQDQYAADLQKDVGYARFLAALGQDSSNPPPSSVPNANAPSGSPSEAVSGGQIEGGALTTSSGQPGIPPGGQTPGNAPPPPQAQPPSTGQAQPAPAAAPGAQQPPVGLPQQGGANSGAADPQKTKQAVATIVGAVEQKAGPATQGAHGTMSAQQLSQLVQKANPGMLEKSPKAFAAVMEQAQRFLNADGKQELAQQKASLEYDAKIQGIQQKADAALRTANNQVEIANLKAETAQQIADIRKAQAEATTAALVAGRQGVADTNVAGKKDVAETNVVGRKDVQADKDKAAGERADKSNATKISTTEISAASRERVAKLAADNRAAIAEANNTAKKDIAGGNMPNAETIRMLGISYAKTGTMPSVGMGNNAVRKAIEESAQQVLSEGGSKEPGADLTANKVGMAGTTAAARSIGTQTGRLDVAARDIQNLAPQVLSASDKVKRTQYPTWNALQIAADRGTGGEDVITLVSKVTALKNAYAQIIGRGQSSVTALKKADAIIDAAWSKGQIKVGIKALQDEAAAAQGAAKGAAADVKDSARGTPAATPAAGGETDPSKMSDDDLKKAMLKALQGGQ